MLKTGQHISQKQSMQQKLSPQQIQFVKLLQLPAVALEQRIKEEMELNPILEEVEPSSMDEILPENQDDWDQKENDGNSDEQDVDPVDQNDDIDWDSFLHNTEYDGSSYSGPSGDDEWRDLPNPYYESLLEELEKQVSLIDFDDEEMLIADQILGSLDRDGYFRRDIEAVVDNIAFNHGKLVGKSQVEKVRRMIQQLEPVGIASVDLRDCLLSQLKVSENNKEIKELAVRMLEDEWDAFEKKHFEKIKSRLKIDDEQLKKVFNLVKGLNPRPGAVVDREEDNHQFIEPDFEVYYEPASKNSKNGEGEFVIRLNQRNSPPLLISPEYKLMWEKLKTEKGKSNDKQAKNFIKDKVESAQWFIDSNKQRQNT